MRERSQLGQRSKVEVQNVSLCQFRSEGSREALMLTEQGGKAWSARRMDVSWLDLIWSEFAPQGMTVMILG